MEVIGEILGALFGGLVDLFMTLLAGLFDIFKPVIIIAIIVIVIVGAVYLGKYIYRTNKAKREEQNYIDAMKTKYANRSKSELVEIYDFLMRLENCRKKAAKKNAYAQSRDEQMSALISDMGVTLMEEQLFTEYPFISYKYRHYDIAYLKKLI